VDSKNKEANTIVALPGEVSLTMIFPKHVSIGLGIGKMESLEYRFDDNRLIIQRKSSDAISAPKIDAEEDQ
jgi:hypothetical protein